ncbi:MAG: hypothetical protein A2342_02660 [Gallionellales bacterium RIFOXYB12_FULL_54_9]|nr:MAG: hypothetical protein A2342_02660 [Gallionellales bacterium RIFOXYB12_FULL_54_9]
MNPMQVLNDAELDELDDFLLSDDTPEGCMDLPALDGFFAALVLNPEQVMPSEYLPWIWDIEEGEEEPSFSSVEQANRIMGLVMRYYNGVLDDIRHGCFAPLFYTLEQEDDSEFYDAEGWAEGFMCGVYLFKEPWTEIFEKQPVLLAPMVLLGTEAGWVLLDKSADPKRATRDAYEHIAESVSQLFEYFAEQRETQMQQRLVQSGGVRVETLSATSFKVGRNEACPCGSGLKYKKCCGASPTVH